MKRDSFAYRAITITLWTLVTLSLLVLLIQGLYQDHVFGFNLPNQGKYKTPIERSRQVQESEIGSSQDMSVQRKASENKRPWLADSFLDMENMVDPDYGGLSRWEGPKYQWPDGTRQDIRPDDFWFMYVGCSVSCPLIMQDHYWAGYYGVKSWCEETGRKYTCNMTFLAGIITGVKVDGPAKIGEWPKWFGEPIPVFVYQNVKNATITVTIKTVSIRKNPSKKIAGSCSAKTLIICEEECYCDGGTPDIYAASSTIAPGGTLDLTVDSGGYACPPYQWTVSGTGYSLNKSTTENDLEYVTLTSAAGTCGVGYGAYATVTVTDACGITDTAKIRNTGGQWEYIAGWGRTAVCDNPNFSGCWGLTCNDNGESHQILGVGGTGNAYPTAWNVRWIPAGCDPGSSDYPHTLGGGNCGETTLTASEAGFPGAGACDCSGELYYWTCGNECN